MRVKLQEHGKGCQLAGRSEGSVLARKDFGEGKRNRSKTELNAFAGEINVAAMNAIKEEANAHPQW
jgi:hypothetical protein